MAKAGKQKHKPGSERPTITADPKKATFSKVGNKNEVDDPNLKAQSGAAVTFSNKISSDVVIVLWGPSIVLFDDRGNAAGQPLSAQEFPRVLFLEGWDGTGDPHSLTFTARVDPRTKKECHYKAIVDFFNGDGDIGTVDKDKLIHSGGADPEIIISG